MIVDPYDMKIQTRQRNLPEKPSRSGYPEHHSQDHIIPASDTPDSIQYLTS